MKVFVFVVIILFIAFAFSQEPPKAVLVDEFGPIPCEDLLARQDYFLSELSNNPQDVGYAIIYSNGRNPKGFLEFLEASLYLRQFDRAKYQIVFSKGSNRDTNGQFWRVPPGASLPKFDSIPSASHDNSKPFLFASDFTDNVCPSFSRDLFSKLINENPGSYVRVVISGPSWTSRKASADAELKMFERANLPKNRIKFVYMHRPKMSFEETEYWYMPAIRK